MNKNKPAYTIMFMLGLTLVFGTGVSLVHHLTRDMLAENEIMHRNKTLTRAFGLEVDKDSPAGYARAVKQNISTQTIIGPEKSWTVHTLDRPGDAQIGFVFQGQGVWDVIRGILVLDRNLETVQGLEFLEQHETPGLGARIEEAEFKNRFKGLEIAWNQPENQRIIIGKDTGTGQNNRVDAITGATQTSMALMQALNAELEAFRELVREKDILRNR